MWDNPGGGRAASSGVYWECFSSLERQEAQRVNKKAIIGVGCVSSFCCALKPQPV